MLPPLLANEPPAPPSLHTADVALPPYDPPSAAVVPPWHIAVTGATLTVGFRFTVSDLFAAGVPHDPPLAVSVNVTGELNVADVVYVVVFGVLPVLFVNDPPAPPSSHTAAVADPPNDPPRVAVVPPWQIALNVLPALTVAPGFTVNDLFAVGAPHAPPLARSVSVTGETNNEDAVYVAVFGVLPALFVNEPPAPPSSHIAAIAVPPNEPPNAVVVPHWQIALTALPALTVAPGFTVNDLFAVRMPQDPPLAVSVNITGETKDEDAV